MRNPFLCFKILRVRLSQENSSHVFILNILMNVYMDWIQIYREIIKIHKTLYHRTYIFNISVGNLHKTNWALADLILQLLYENNIQFQILCHKSTSLGPGNKIISGIIISQLLYEKQHIKSPIMLITHYSTPLRSGNKIILAHTNLLCLVRINDWFIILLLQISVNAHHRLFIITKRIYCFLIR